MGTKNKFNLKLPQDNQNNKDEIKNSEKSHIDLIKESVREQFEEIAKYQNIEITEKNQDEVRKIVLATQDLINSSIDDNLYSGNRDETFVNLLYVYNKLDLKLETYYLTLKMEKLNSKSDEIQQKQDKITERQNKEEEKSNNLVYNLLGFLTAFSIVSAVIETITRINGIINIMIFMAFTILILLTTLIALHNFYENRNKRENILQNNYFLWIIIAVILLGLIIIYVLKNNLINLGS